MGCVSNTNQAGKFKPASQPLGYNERAPTAQQEPIHAEINIGITVFELNEDTFTGRWAYYSGQASQEFPPTISNQIERAFLCGSLIYRTQLGESTFTIRFSDMIMSDDSDAPVMVQRVPLKPDEFEWEVSEGQFRPFPPEIQDFLIAGANEATFEFDRKKLKVNKNTNTVLNIQSGTTSQLKQTYANQSSLA